MSNPAEGLWLEIALCVLSLGLEARNDVTRLVIEKPRCLTHSSEDIGHRGTSEVLRESRAVSRTKTAILVGVP